MSVAQTERFFFAALYQRDLEQLLAKLNGNLVGVLERRCKAGQANKADVALPRLEFQSARRQSELAQANYQTALMKLMNHLNLDATATMELVGQWSDWQWCSVEEMFAALPDDSVLGDAGRNPKVAVNGAFDDTVLRQLIADRPDVAASRAATAAARANLGLADAARTPDL